MAKFRFDRKKERHYHEKSVADAQERKNNSVLGKLSGFLAATKKPHIWERAFFSINRLLHNGQVDTNYWRNKHELFKWMDEELSGLFARIEDPNQMQSLKALASLVEESYRTLPETGEQRASLSLLLKDIDKKIVFLGGEAKKAQEKVKSLAVKDFPFSFSKKLMEKEASYAAIESSILTKDVFETVKSFFEQKRGEYGISKWEDLPGGRLYYFKGGEKTEGKLYYDPPSIFVQFNPDLAQADGSNVLANLSLILGTSEYLSLHLYSSEGNEFKNLSLSGFYSAWGCWFKNVLIAPKKLTLYIKIRMGKNLGQEEAAALFNSLSNYNFKNEKCALTPGDTHLGVFRLGRSDTLIAELYGYDDNHNYTPFVKANIDLCIALRERFKDKRASLEKGEFPKVGGVKIAFNCAYKDVEDVAHFFNAVLSSFNGKPAYPKHKFFDDIETSSAISVSFLAKR